MPSAAFAKQHAHRMRHVAHVPPVVKRFEVVTRQAWLMPGAYFERCVPLSGCATRAAEMKARNDERSTEQLSATPALRTYGAQGSARG